MKRIMIYAIVILMFAVTMLLNAQDSRDFSRTYKVNPGGELLVRTNPGEINIHTWQKNEVKIVVEGLDKENVDNLEITESTDKIRIEYNSDWGWDNDVSFKITIPEKFNITAKTTGGEVELRDNLTGNVNINSAGGDITIADVNGDVDVSTSGGNIRTGSVNGSFMVNTMGGDIDAVNVSGDKARVKTMGGDIQMRNVKAPLDLQTYGGDIEVGTLEGISDLSTYGGNIHIESSKEGLKLNTYGGNIRVGDAQSYVEAKTAGGNINLKSVHGYVRAKTNAGNITVALYPSGTESSVISTNSGEIDLAVPANAKLDIEAEINIHGWWDNSNSLYEIISDFKADNYKKNEKKSEISANYTLNGGGQRVTLKAVNSGIKIKKLK